MDEQRPGETPRRYEETTHPNNPPNSVVDKSARRAAVWSYFVPVVVLFVVIGIALLYWANRPSHSDAGEPRTEVGTVGSTEGGFDPQDTSRPGSTREEIEQRGGDLAPVIRLSDLHGVDARTAAGRRVMLSNVEVDAVDGNVVWLRDDDQRYAVVASDGAPAVKTGAKVNVSGRIEPDGKGGIQIRADRVTQR